MLLLRQEMQLFIRQHFVDDVGGAISTPTD